MYANTCQLSDNILIAFSFPHKLKIELGSPKVTQVDIIAFY